VVGGNVKAIADVFLRAKHWQIFFLFFAAPTFAEFSAVGVIPARIRSWHDFGAGGLFYLSLDGVIFLCLLAWFGSMGFFLRSIVKPELRMGTRFLRFALVYPVVYLPIFFFWLIPETAPAWVILPLHLACMVCLIYLFYYASKNLALTERRRQVSFYEYAGAFFLLSFYPVGVWVIQPKLNRLYAEDIST
jgi:hypothetical protein